MAARLFVAVWPPPEIVELLAGLPRPSIPGLRWTEPGQWHVTLRFLGRVENVSEVSRALRPLRLPEVDVRAGPEVGRFGQRVLHVPVEGLAAATGAVVDATRHLGEPPEDRAFSGHITLARVSKRARVDLRPLRGRPIHGAWRVTELTLVESRLRPSGVDYEIVDRFPLMG
ncbi:MAG: RNA 2',3'-cyclic phosphodiesterase [Acidimicrobiales bacterium]